MNRGLPDLPRELERLEGGQLIRALVELEPTYSFKHNLVQQVAYESLLASDRRSLHRAVGETLERIHPEARQDLAEILASHFEHAGEGARAVEYFDIAGGQAMRRFATSEAAVLFAKAIELAGASEFDPSRLLHLYLQRGRALELRGDHAAALLVYEEMESLGRARTAPQLQLAGIIGAASLQAVPTPLFDPIKAMANAKRALSLAESIGDPAGQAKAYWLEMLVQTRLHAPQAVAAGLASLDLARRYGLREQEAFTLNDIQSNYQVLGQPDLALQALEAARPLWRELDNLPMLADNLASTAMLHAVVTRYALATELSRQALAISDRTGNLWGQSYGRVGLCLTHFGRGELGPAIREMTRCIDVAELAGFVFPQVAIRALLSIVYARVGDISRAAQLAERIVEVEAGSSVKGQLTGIAALASVAVQQGDLDRAGSLLRGVRISADALGMQLGESPIPLAFTLPAYHLARRDFEETLRVIDLFSQAFDRFGWEIVNNPVLLARGRALAGLGRTSEARETLEALRQQLESQGDPPALWEVENELGRMARTRGDPSALTLLSSARRRLGEIADGLRELGLAESFLSQPHIRSILEEADVGA